MGNPFDPEGTNPPVNPPSVPISGNPFDPSYAVDRPHPATMLGNAADVAKAASNTFSMGMRDRMEGAYRALTGEAPSYSTGVEQAVADSAIRRERSPYLSALGDVAGGTAQAYVPGVGATGRALSAAMGGAGRGAYPAAARMLGYGVEGGLLGAGQAAGQTYTGNPADYARNALIGGAFSGVLGSPFGKFADVAPRSLAEVPNSAELKASTTNRYTSTHNIPIEYSTPQFRSAMDALETKLHGITDPDKSKTVWHTLGAARSGRLQADPNSPTITPKDIDALRQKLTGVNEPGAYQFRNFLDAFSASPIAQVAGTDAQRNALTKSLLDARSEHRAAKRTEAVEETNQYAGDRAAVANSGMNVGNTYGQRLTTKFLSPTSPEYRWSTPAERDEVRAVARRDPFYNALNKASNMMGGGLGPGAGLYGGGGALSAFTAGDWRPFAAGIAIPTLGYAAKTVGNRAMVNAAEGLADTFAMRSPLYRDRAANAPMVAGPGLGNFPEASRNAIINQVLEQARLRGLMQTPEEQ